MKQKIKLKICSGTACFITGGSELLTIFDHLSPKEQECISLMAIPCFEQCNDGKGHSPPFVIIDGVIHNRMTIEKLSIILIQFFLKMKRFQV